VPHGYLRWVLENLKLSPFVKQDIQTVLEAAQEPAASDGTSYDPGRYINWDYEGQPGEIESRLTEADIPY
jgi:hypothetical protein